MTLTTVTTRILLFHLVSPVGDDNHDNQLAAGTLLARIWWSLNTATHIHHGPVPLFLSKVDCNEQFVLWTPFYIFSFSCFTSSVKTPSHSLVSLAPTNEGGDLSNPRMDLYEVEKSFW